MGKLGTGSQPKLAYTFLPPMSGLGHHSSQDNLPLASSRGWILLGQHCPHLETCGLPGQRLSLLHQTGHSPKAEVMPPPSDSLSSLCCSSDGPSSSSIGSILACPRPHLKAVLSCPLLASTWVPTRLPLQ